MRRRTVILLISALLLIVLGPMLLGRLVGPGVLLRLVNRTSHAEKCNPSVEWYNKFISDHASDLETLKETARAILSRTGRTIVNIPPSPGTSYKDSDSTSDILRRLDSIGMSVGRTDGAIVEIDMCSVGTIARGHLISLAYFDSPPPINDAGQLSYDKDIEVYPLEGGWYVLRLR